MTNLPNRMEMLEATLDLLDEGVALLDDHAAIVLWNKAATLLTGRQPIHLVSRPCPPDLYQINEHHLHQAELDAHTESHAFSGHIAGYTASTPLAHNTDPTRFLDKPTLVDLKHHLGHTIPAMLRKLPLRDPLGARIGAALFFHAVEDADVLPHGDSGEGVGVERGQADMEDRLDQAQHQWLTNRVPFGLLWLTVDQAAVLRRTHGREACESMLTIVRQTLIRGLRPTEIIGRWGDDEFLILSHERSENLLLDDAHRLAGLARTAEFRWWGDRISLTVSIGAALIGDDCPGEQETLSTLLKRTQQAMHASLYSGGNHVTKAKGQECSL
jgi:diguanylate cyclase (GGDEF)-like protein